MLPGSPHMRPDDQQRKNLLMARKMRPGYEYPEQEDLPMAHMRHDHPEEENLLMDQLALHVLQGRGFLDPSPDTCDWHGSTMIPAWQRDGARDSAYSIASCFRQSATRTSRSPAEVQPHTSNATPYFGGSPAFTWSGAGAPGSEPDLGRSVRFPAF